MVNLITNPPTLETQLPTVPTINPLPHIEVPNLPTSTISLSNRLIERLDDWENRLDHLLPNFSIQNKIDQLGQAIKEKFAPLARFSEWLDEEGEGSWYQKLAVFLYKLPMRAVRNIVRMLYSIIENALYAAVHPLKATLQLAKAIVGFVSELTKPETWSKIGAGIVGGALGQALGSGNPLSLIGFAIGGAMMLGGITAGALKEALEAETGKKIEAVNAYLFDQLKNLPETALTGFLIGLLIGSTQRGQKQAHAEVEQANQFVKDHDLPQYSSVHVNESGDAILRWDGIDKFQLEKMNLQFFSKKYLPQSLYFHSQQMLNFAELNLSSTGLELSFNFKTFGIWKWGETNLTFNRVISLDDFLKHNWQAFRDVVVENSNNLVYG